MSRDHVCAVDVGTGSARAGIFAIDATLVGQGSHPILINRSAAGHAEHDSEDIWRAVCHAVSKAVASSGLEPGSIAAISFDATCSLVIRGEGGRQVSASTTGEENWDTVVWLDHRALAEAEECTATGHRVLDYVGGVMSPEMQVPKLMWLKRHLPQSWRAASHFFDLADFLTWKACGSTARSQCTLTAKWTYLAHCNGWQRDFLATVGLEDMLERGSLPDLAVPAGSLLGTLTPEAASMLGLDTECVVGAGMIDAFAGTLGLVGRHAGEGVGNHFALIAGTSSCVMGFAQKERQVRGIWGPCFGATLPGLWMSEGGQSATGALLDHLIRWHAAGGEPDAQTHGRIIARINELRAREGAGFASRLHVLPDFHGNRSPLADSQALGVISGLTLDTSFDSFCRLYWRSCVAIALGVRHILDAFNAGGHNIDTLHVTGGHTRNPLLMELYPEVTGCILVEPAAENAMLLGTAMAAASAGRLYDGLYEACRAMSRPGTMRVPDKAAWAIYERDYRIFLEMLRQRAALDRME